jgi:antagonist of KipI
MTLRFEKAGLLTTVQDLGRVGFARFGINRNGVMDIAAARLINILLGNKESAPVIEMHYPAPQIVFEKNGVFAIGGAELGARVNGAPVANWRAFSIKKGDVLSFENKTVGSRAYLAVRGGLKTDEWLGSSSTNMIAEFGGNNGKKIAAGDTIEYDERTSARSYNTAVSYSLIPYYGRFPTVRVIAGAEYELLSASGKELLEDHDYTVTSRSDRMGFRLAGEAIRLEMEHEFISSAVTFGTVQLLPDGQLIVLMADHQTAGGYPRIAHVISRDLPLVAQLGPNDKLAFHLITLAEAEALAAEFERELRLFRVGCRLLWNAAS